jgi:ribonuclease-3
MPNPDAKLLLLHRLGHEFRDSRLAERALTHRSFSAEHNERLEFLGDSILNFVIAEALYERFPKAPEGDLSRMRARLVKGETLAEIARGFQLGESINLGAGEMKSGGHRRESILADAVEALIGAIYLDAGLDVCRLRVRAWYNSRLAQLVPGDLNKDAKTRLQEMLQARAQSLPIYRVVETSGEEHKQQFEIACEIAALQESFVGHGNNRRTAEQAAAELAIVRLEEVWAQP